MGVKREALNRLGWRSVHGCVGLRRLGAAVSSSSSICIYIIFI